MDNAINWQPIESAPKDGTDVLLFHDSGMSIGRWRANPMPRPLRPEPGFWFSDISDEYGESVPATHWMPLPAPPALDRIKDQSHGG